LRRGVLLPLGVVIALAVFWRVQPASANGSKIGIGIIFASGSLCPACPAAASG